MEAVTDTSILLAVVLSEPEKDRLVRLTAGATLTAPEILPYEVGNALSAMVKRERLSQEQALEAKALVDRIAVRLVPVDIAAALHMALGHHIYAYDAYFLQCARSLSRPLLTLDRRMRQVAADAGVRVLELPP